MADQNSESTGTKEKRGRPESIDISRIMLQSGQNSPRKPPPTERISSSPTTRTSMESVQTSTSTISHSRSSSTADYVNTRQNKRLSLNGFPVQQPNSRPSRPPSWIMSPPKPPEDVLSSTEGSFLTVLASQERRVLELKEELRQAELELDRLKRHYSMREAGKKRIDIRKATQLQPLTASLSLSTLETAEEDEDGSSNWMQKEMERRKALLKGMKTSNRKTFKGSRHTRTLSLLSPEKSEFSQPISPSESEARRSDSISSRPPPLTRSSTTSDICESPMRPADLPQLDGTQTKDALMRTGKQMAFDLKDGLMTFFEDIRQATVGDEGGPVRATQGQGRQPSRTIRGGRPGQLNRAASARTAHNNNDTLIDIGGSFWRDHGMGMDSPQPKATTRTASKTTKAKREATPVKTDTDDDWDSWGTPIKLADSPNPSDEESIASSQSDTRSTPLTSAGGLDSPAPLTDRTLTPRSVTTPSSATKRDSIPWPNLEKLPGNLKRTASHLMKEWEKTMGPLSPSLERVGGSVEHDSDSGLDYPYPSPQEDSSSHSTSPALGSVGRVKVKKAD